MKEGLSDGASSSTATWTMYDTFSMGERSGELRGQFCKISFIRLLRKKNVPFGRLETPFFGSDLQTPFCHICFFQQEVWDTQDRRGRRRRKAKSRRWNCTLSFLIDHEPSCTSSNPLPLYFPYQLLISPLIQIFLKGLAYLISVEMTIHYLVLRD